MIRGEHTDLTIGQHLVFWRGAYAAVHDPYHPYECRGCNERTMLAHFEITPLCVPRRYPSTSERAGIAL